MRPSLILPVFLLAILAVAVGSQAQAAERGGGGRGGGGGGHHEARGGGGGEYRSGDVGFNAWYPDVDATYVAPSVYVDTPAVDVYTPAPIVYTTPSVGFGAWFGGGGHGHGRR